MGSEWKSYSFAELYAQPSRNGLMKPKRVRGEGFKFINMGEIFKFDRMLNIPCDRVPLTEKEQQSSLMLAGDLLFARQSLTLAGAGKCSIFLGDDEPVAYESHLIRVRLDDSIIDPEFAYYFFNSPLGKAEMWTIIEQGAGQAGIRGSDLENLQLPCPNVNYQKKIANIFSTIDNKIELNRQINQTLEQMAQALFKSWFVDFDPVIDNALAAGNPIPEELQARAQRRQQQLAKPDHQPLPDDVRQLFPSEFEETEALGWVPKGWKSKKLPEVIDFLEGPGIRNWQYTNSDEGVKFINIRCIQGGDLKLETANRITKEEAFGKYAHFQLKEHDLVISTSGTLGRFSFVREEHLPLSLNTSVIRFRAIDDVSTLQFIAGYCATGLQWELGSRATGSAQLNFGPMHLKKISMLLPSYNVLLKYEEIAGLLFTKKQVNLKQIDKLTKLRDTLLPKLISGGLRLPESMLDSETNPPAETAYE